VHLRRLVLSFAIFVSLGENCCRPAIPVPFHRMYFAPNRSPGLSVSGRWSGIMGATQPHTARTSSVRPPFPLYNRLAITRTPHVCLELRIRSDEGRD